MGREPAFPRRRTVVIADDHAVVRQGVAQVLIGIPHVGIVGEAADGLAAIAMVKKLKPDLLVLDAALPLARGIEVFADVRRWSPETRVALLTGFTSAGILADWLNAGVDGVFLKSCPPEELRMGFEAMLAGSDYVADGVREALQDAAAPVSLTAREREVLSLIASGHSNPSIAERLSISPKTVEKHRGSLMTKLDVHSVAELLVYALREGLLDEHKQL
jgi:DNA-binding NarL/FixJ family response regulator